MAAAGSHGALASPRMLAGYPVSQTLYAPAGRPLRLLHPGMARDVTAEEVECWVYAEEDFLPFWAQSWPSGLVLAEWLLRRPERMGGAVLELGCGLGLAGLAALACARHVVFSDREPSALQFAAASARLNRFTDFETLTLDWRRPIRRPFDTIVGADVIYQPRLHQALASLLDAMLAPGGSVVLGDPCRPVAGRFLDACQAAGFRTTHVSSSDLVLDGASHRVTVYVLQRAGA